MLRRSFDEMNPIMLQIDGSRGEGGGQMVRTALALSALTGRPFGMTRIRANRPKGGLKAQHLMAIEALQAICSATVTEVRLGAEAMAFEPGKVQPGNYSFDIGTAGSISLLLQALLPPLLFASGPSTLHLKGGTCGKWQPPVVYTQQVLLPYLARFADIELAIGRQGYFPKGGGEVTARIQPKLPSRIGLATLPPYLLTEGGRPVRMGGLAFAADTLAGRQVAERMASSAQIALREWNCPVDIETAYGPAYDPGAGIVLWAETGISADGSPLRLGADALGERGKPAETVGREAARQLRNTLRANTPVDEHLADQLAPFLGLLPGSRIRVGRPSGHLLSNMAMTELFLPVRFARNGQIFEVEPTEEL